MVPRGNYFKIENTDTLPKIMEGSDMHQHFLVASTTKLNSLKIQALPKQLAYYRKLPLNKAHPGHDIVKMRKAAGADQQIRQIIAHIWEEHALPLEGIIEYGAGPVGYFNNARPEGVAPFTEFDISPAVVKANLEVNPDSIVRTGNYFDIKEKNVSLITGMNCWGASGFLRLAVKQVANALESGGYFLAIEDNAPSADATYQYVKSSHKKKRVVPCLRKGVTFLGYQVGDEHVTAIGALKGSLGEAIEQNEKLDLMANSYVTLLREIPLGNGTIHYQCGLTTNTNEALPPMAGMQNYSSTSLLVTLAKKI